MKKILVAGGAGFIGSHTVKALLDQSYKVLVIDNLSKGFHSAIDKRAEHFDLDLLNFASLEKFFSEYEIHAVMHFAGVIEAGLSMQQPQLFFENNTRASANLAEAMRQAGVLKIIFSSTAAVYGEPKTVPIAENADLHPTNFYGTSKLMVEELLRSYDEMFGMKFVALRYFNAAGSAQDGSLGERHEPETHLIPRILRTLRGDYENFQLFGTDYATKDGTCVRDYIHVEDLVDAHLLALVHLLNDGKSEVFNLGNGAGFSVKEVIEAGEKVTGKKLTVVEAPRRVGDPAVLVADAGKAREVLGWQPKHFSLEKIMEDAWQWFGKAL